MIMPGVQKPHWRPCFSQKAACIGWSVVAVGEALDGHDLGAVGLDREHRAGLDRPAVDVDGAGAALAGVAADVRAGQVEVLAQRLDEEASRLDVELAGRPIDDERDVFAHGHEPPAARWVTGPGSSRSAMIERSWMVAPPRAESSRSVTRFVVRRRRRCVPPERGAPAADGAWIHGRKALVRAAPTRAAPLRRDGPSWRPRPPTGGRPGSRRGEPDPGRTAAAGRGRVAGRPQERLRPVVGIRRDGQRRRTRSRGHRAWSPRAASCPGRRSGRRPGWRRARRAGSRRPAASALPPVTRERQVRPGDAVEEPVVGVAEERPLRRSAPIVDRGRLVDLDERTAGRRKRRAGRH